MAWLSIIGLVFYLLLVIVVVTEAAPFVLQANYDIAIDQGFEGTK